MRRTFSLVYIFIFSVTSVAQTSTTAIQPPPQSSDPAAEIRVNAEEEKKSDAKPEKKVERVRVTGSHIKRIDTEGVSPVQTVTRKELEKTGHTGIADVLRDQTANSFGSLKEQSGSNAAGVAHVDLRGLGSSSTLVLLNGQRLPTDAVTGAVDLNLIPMAAIERVEVLKDGASAIYGSDALGGVVNIITRKDFSGTEVSFKQTVPQMEGGKRRDISIVNGISKGRVNMVNVAQYRDNEVIFARERDWSNKGYSQTGSPGSYFDSAGNTRVDPNCPPEMIETTATGQVCRFRFSDYATTLPALQQMSIMSETNVEVSSRVRAKARLGGTQRKVQWQFAPSPGAFNMPASVADTAGPNGGPLPGVNPGEDVTLMYRVTELGPRETEVTSYAYNILGGAEVDVGKGWQVETNLSHNRVTSRDEGVSGYALKKDVEAAIANGTFKPFAPAGQRGSLEATRYRPVEITKAELSSADIKASGEFGHLPAGRFGLAVGSTFTFQKYSDNADEMSVNGEVFGGSGSQGAGQRDTKAVYSELSIPVTRKLEFQIAGRYDKYSDFGDTFNPKAGLSYKPVKSLLLRSSVGTGFKAPLMQDLYAAESSGYQNFIDHVACENEKAAGGLTTSCLPRQYLVTSSGNEGLKEEKSFSVTGGAVYEPNRDFNISFDGFYTRMNNVVGIDYEDAMKAEQKFGAAHLAEKGVIVERHANGSIKEIKAPLQNLSKREIMGLDVGAGYRFWKIQLGNNFAKMFYYKEEGFPGAGYTNKLGNAGLPGWRNTASLGFLANDRNSLTFDAITTPRQRKTVKSEGETKDYTTVDMQYNWRWTKNSTITAGVKNLFGTTPPIDETNPTEPFDSTIYDEIGRQYYTALKASF